MKRHAIPIMVILGLGSLGWGTAQTTRSDLFDIKKSREELEIMKGILGTTIGFVANDVRSHEVATPFGKRETYVRIGRAGSDITAYYLYGQGATFIIPFSSFHYSMKMGPGYPAPKIAAGFADGMEDSMYQLQQQLDAAHMEMAVHNEEMAAAARDASEAAEELAREMADEQMAAAGSVSGGVPGGVGVGVGKGTGQGIGAPQAAPSPPAAPTPPPPPAKLSQQKRAEDARRKLEEMQANLKKSQEEMAARNKKLLESINQISGYLVEALANYGDSLTLVKPGEYINIILTTDTGTFWLGDTGENDSRRRVISVQKSFITDYKAGRLNLDAFKQKVLLYND